MSRLIVVWGSPQSGKTTLAVKLALALYERYKSTVILLHTDMETPVLPVLFANRKADELYSAGVPLSQTEVTKDEVIRAMNTVKGKQNFTLLGFKDGENADTYPKFDEPRIGSLISILKELADFVLVDCVSGRGNLLSDTALEKADQTLRLATPDLRCMSFYASQAPLYADPKYRFSEQAQGLALTQADIYLPVEDVKQYLKEVSFTLPYCRELRQQMEDGTLLHGVRDKKYRAKLQALADRMAQT